MVETEQAVIGCLILDWAACRQPDVEPEWFETAFYGEIVRRGRALEADGIKPDHVTLLEGMNEEGKREVLRCAQLVPSIPSYPNYVRQLKQEWRRRTIQERLNAIMYDGNDADDMTESLRILVAEQDALIAADRREIGQTLADAYTDFYNDLYEKDVRYLSGYRDLDRLMGGLLPGSVFVLAARSGQGKTDFALALMLLYAAAGHKVLYYSMEMSKQQMMVRVAAQVSKIYNTRIRDKKLTDKEKSWISHAFGLIRGREAIRVSEERPNLAAIREHIRTWQPAIVFLDHLSLMKMPRRKSRVDEVAETTRGLKALALETGTAVVELVQMNREVERRTSKRPLLSDLKESGTIEEDADYVMFLQAHKSDEPLKGNEAYETFGYLEKNRHGGTGRVKFAWRPQYSRFAEIHGNVEDRYGQSNAGEGAADTSGSGADGEALQLPGL